MNLEQKKDLVDRMNLAGLEVENSLDKRLRRQTGSYYTSLVLTLPMAKELVENLTAQKKDKIHKLKFLEPCVGTGNFVFAYILVASDGLSNDKVKILLENIYVCDINKEALRAYKKQLRYLAESEFGIKLDDHYFSNHMGGGLLFDVTKNEPEYTSIDDIFGKGSSNSFDIIMTNPPYKNLKAELGHYDSAGAKEMDKKKYDIIGREARKVLPLSSSGTLNLYKMFVEEILDKYASSDALVSLLIPTSILSDKTCEILRAKIINDHHIVSLKNVPEKNTFINAQQALTAILIDKSVHCENRLTSICKSYLSTNEQSTMLELKKIANKENGYNILLLDKKELELLESMSKHPRIKDLSFIVNLRGELDLTANKSAISSQKTVYKMLRGRNIAYYKMTGLEECDHVEPKFVAKSNKSSYIQNDRLACQQISNIAKERRLTFVKIPANYVLANSCNFITIIDNEYDLDLNYIYGLLNSKLLNWFFKVHSSNNHINNYEIDNFPVPVTGGGIKDISKLVGKLDSNNIDSAILDKIDDLVVELYSRNKDYKRSPKKSASDKQSESFDTKALQDLKGILPNIKADDAEALLNDQQSIEATTLKYSPSISKMDTEVLLGIVNKYRKLKSGEILNHTTFKLSDLDMEMIRPIPQGGNWKDIPEVTTLKSRRLTRIRETGGRTTLYGRLDYMKPSYTITTYFNRPGNGTYVHPIHDRVLSVREAARIQSFPDNYYFYGNKTQLLKQIGNAVPALLAYQIGSKIVDKLGRVKSLDLFCGAGGLTVGLKQAGINTVLCTDFDKASCTTIKINNPEIEVICGDITEKTVKENITESAKASNADLVCGGPPCQGFSMAGYRDKNDPRNQLFKEFVSIVKSTKPKVVLFENVQGILTFNGGETYSAIHQLFSDLGYYTEGRLLNIDKYGVPQKRKRVIIICTRKDIGISPSELYPDETSADDQLKVTMADTIADLESVPCSDNATYATNTSQSGYNEMLKGTISPKDFLQSITVREHTLTAK